MKEKLAASALMAGVLLTVFPDQLTDADVSNQITVEQTAQGVEIDLSRIALPSVLPPAVERDAESAVAIQSGHYVGSGVKVGPSEVLTAGHMLTGGELGGTDSPAFNCGGMMITSTAPRTKVNGDKPYDRMLVNYATSVDTSNYPTGIVSYEEDFADLQLSANATMIDQYVPSVSMSVHSTPVPVGEVVYFVNDEPTSTHHLRTPAATVSPEAIDTDVDYSKPAEYAGIVIKDDGNKMYVLNDVGKSYGEGAPATESVPGSSGGGVFSEYGQLDGLSDAGYTKKMNATEIRQQLAVQITGNSPQDEYQVSIVEKVDRQDLSTLPPMQNCEQW